MLGEDHRSRRQLRDLMARRLPERLALRRAEDMAVAAATGPVVDQLVERLDRRQATTASRMARLGASLAPRRSSSPARRRSGRILAGRRRGVAGVAVQAPLELGDALVLLGEALAQLGDLSPKAERSAPRAPGAQRQSSQAPAQRPPQPRRVPCPRASRRRGEGLLMPPRPSPPRYPWVDQLFWSWPGSVSTWRISGRRSLRSVPSTADTCGSPSRSANSGAA